MPGTVLTISSEHEPQSIRKRLMVIPFSKGSVNDMRQMTLKKLHNVKNSSEWSKFLRFNLYLCHAVLMNC